MKRLSVDIGLLYTGILSYEISRYVHMRYE